MLNVENFKSQVINTHDEHIHFKEINVYMCLYMLHLLKCHLHCLMVYSAKIGKVVVVKHHALKKKPCS
jgi:hypothetical protein